MTGLHFQRIRALRGPNIWARFPVLEAWVDLGELKDSSSDELPGFNDRLKELLPSLVEHRCSVGERGGFYQRLARGTYMAHIFEHVVLELQTLAGTDVGYGKTRETSTDGLYKVAIEYDDEEMGLAACELGKDVCLAAVNGTPVDLAAGLDRLRAILAKNTLPPGVAELLAAAKRRNVPARVLEGGPLVQLGTGARQHRVFHGQTDRSSGVGASIANDRELTRTLLESAGVPTVWCRPVRTADDAWAVAEDDLPVVLRPRSVCACKPIGPLASEAEVRAAFDRAYNAEDWVPMVEPAVPGGEYRLLVTGGRVVGAIDAGGRDVTDRLHPDVVARAADAAFALKLDVAAVEVVTPDLGRSLEAARGAVVGVLAHPDLAAFAGTAGGDPRPVADTLVDRLYPDPRQSRIPVVAVTGTNGKTTTTRLVAHLMSTVWAPVGMTCTEGIYIGGRRIDSGDCSGPKSARVVLQHPSPRAAALETARGGMLREGLGFDKCDVAVVTNIDEGDHLGTADVDTPEQLANVKSTIVWAVAAWGAAVLNAADPLVVDMRKLCDGAVIFFARDGANPVLAAHRAAGGRALFVRGNAIILADGDKETVLVGLDRVPLTHGGRVSFQVENVLAATAAAWFLGVPLDAIRRGLETFDAGIGQAPGRFNLLSVDGVTVVFDYGHNTSSLTRLLEVLSGFPHARRTAVYSAAGDRRDADLIKQGEMLGDFFDRVILYEDQYVRGRKEGEIFAVFRKGLAVGKRTTDVRDVKGGIRATELALALATPGDLILVQPDTVDDGVAVAERLLARGGRQVTLSEAVAISNPPPKPATATAVRESRLGRAVIAARPVLQGEVVARGWGPLTAVRSMHTIQVAIDRHLDPPEPIRYLNHSCDPNCALLIRTGVEEVELHALRDIDADEELTVDYETFEAEIAALTGPCLCQAPGCRGSLVGYAGLPADRRAYFGKYVAEYLRGADIPVAHRAVVGT